MQGKVALITGAAAGIGAACARRIAQDGVSIGVLDLDKVRCTETVESVRSSGGKAVALGADITRQNDVLQAVAECREALGPITIVVNNAGITDFTPFEEVTEELWNRVYRVNVLGTILVTQAVLPHMKAAKWGRVVNISSSSAQTGSVNMTTYSSSKGAIVTLTRSLAQELGPLGITVNNVAPGAIMNTIMSEANKHRAKLSQEQLLKAIPVRRTGEPVDLANAVAWLCQEATGYFTGQTVGVNGGRVVT
ncbi:MAG TPA: SDR family NAD(P)-dependent oxidoreductase [Steroidobacteraceae bacterium]|jgi:2-hydroxycyclohexanecarboxyl-CoA dehydrogenase|nr:SDR family NAD(P)-dependent oxidoreductase [Steroidobacteraceae bacterium]